MVSKMYDSAARSCLSDAVEYSRRHGGKLTPYALFWGLANPEFPVGRRLEDWRYNRQRIEERDENPETSAPEPKDGTVPMLEETKNILLDAVRYCDAEDHFITVEYVYEAFVHSAEGKRILNRLNLPIDLDDPGCSNNPFTVDVAGESDNIAYAHMDDAGADLCSCEEATIYPMGRILVNTGLRMRIPEGYTGMVCPRSGLALKHGLTVLNAPGIVDAGYRGEVGVILYNASNMPFQIHEGDRIAQMVFVRAEHATFHKTMRLDESDRGVDGFGSTGI